ncbi:MAG: hypothetical protein ACI9DH_001216 [Halioglobus sp.]|jgi:hypothetical protein
MIAAVIEIAVLRLYYYHWCAAHFSRRLFLGQIGSPAHSNYSN